MKKHFMNGLTSDISLELALSSDILKRKVNGKVKETLVKNGKAYWVFIDKNGEKRWGMEQVRESETVKTE